MANNRQLNTSIEKTPRKTGKYLFEKNVTDERMQSLLNDIVLDKDEFKQKYNFDRTSIFPILDDLRDKYPEEKLRSMMQHNNSNASNIYVTQKRIRNSKEIRIKVSNEIFEEYQFLMSGYKDTLKPEIFSEVLRRGMQDLLARKRTGESIVRVAAIEEQEL